MSDVRRQCPDGGTCHHDCKRDNHGCFRVKHCGPLSGVYPNDRWPEEVKKIEARSVTTTDAWGRKIVVGGFGSVGDTEETR